MADIYKITMFLSGRLQGWSESYAVSRDNTNPMQVRQSLFALLSKRQALMAEQYQIDGTRVMKYRLGSNGTILKNKGILDEFSPPLVGTAGQGIGGDSFRLAVLVRGRTTDGFAAKPIYMGGFPDAICRDGGILDVGQAGWLAKFQSWAGEANTQGIGYLQNVVDKQVPIDGYTVSAFGTVDITVPAGTWGTKPVGSKIQVRIAGVNGKSPLNGAQVVTISSDTTCQLDRYMALLAYKFGGTLTTYTYPFTTVPDWVALKVAGHKRGKSPLASRGRSRARVVA